MWGLIGLDLCSFMQRIAQHPVLRKDAYLKMFLETDQKLPKPPSTTLSQVSAWKA